MSMLHHGKLEIHQREKEGIAVLDLHGKLVLGDGDRALHDFVQSLLDGGNSKLALNAAGIPEIDTSGMQLLLFLAEAHRNAGGKLVLFNVAHAHGKVYEMARLEANVEIYRDELDAVNSFFPDRVVAHYDILEYVESQPPHEDQDHKI
jgi:anti-sigma B factor antagonist